MESFHQKQTKALKYEGSITLGTATAEELREYVDFLKAQRYHNIQSMSDSDRAEIDSLIESAEAKLNESTDSDDSMKEAA